MKKVLFLGPNYKYIRTTATGIAKELVRRGIPFATNVHIYPNAAKYEEGELHRLYLKTSEVEVTFNFDDPVLWSIETLAGVDGVFGKKELVKTMRENFPARVVMGKCSVQRYIVEYTSNVCAINTDLIVDDIHPVKTHYIPSIKNVYFNDPMTIVIWDDGTKTMVKCQGGDVYSKETGLALCISKKAFGNKGNFNDIFKKWIPEEKEEVERVTVPLTDGVKSNLNIDAKYAINAVNDYLDNVFKDIRNSLKRGAT